MGLVDLATVPPGSDRKLASMFLRPLDANTGQPVGDMDPMKLQFWPETIQYQRGSVGWQPRPVPGLSHNLFSWTQGGVPTLSFELVLVNERDPSFKPKANPPGILSGEYNFEANITSGLAWFAAAGNPRYDGLDEPVQPPPLISVIPQYLPPEGGSDAIEMARAFGRTLTPGTEPGTTLAADIDEATRFSHLPDRDFIGVLMDFGVNYEKFYPTGVPRIATVSLTFSEVIQIGDVILPHNRSQNLQIAQHFNLLAPFTGAAPAGSGNIIEKGKGAVKNATRG